MAPALIPELHAIATDSRYPVGMQRRALTILHGMLETLGLMTGADQKHARDMMVPLMQPWVPTLATIISADITLVCRSTGEPRKQCDVMWCGCALESDAHQSVLRVFLEDRVTR